MKVAALLVALAAAASPVVADADIPKIIAVRQMGNMTRPTTTTVPGGPTGPVTSTDVMTRTRGGGGSGGSGGSGGGSGMPGGAPALHGTAVGASALALAGVVGALAIGL